MIRTHWTVEEFWKMFEPADSLARQLGADDDEVEINREAATRFWLMFTPVAGIA